MQITDRLISALSPSWGLKRVKARQALAIYEATRPSATRKNPKSNTSANVLNQNAAADLRGMARHLEENYDFASGTLDVLVRNTVGKAGIGIEPAPKDREGNIHAEAAEILRHLWLDFIERPETTHTLDWAMTCQLMARTWFRDGEAFSKAVIGNVPKFSHGTRVPLSLELLEPDYCPFDYQGDRNQVVQGIRFNAWRQPTTYFFYDKHPGELSYLDKVRPVRAEFVDHVRHVKRLHQARGVSAFASVVSRLNNIKDYESYEQVAARIAASMTAYIKKGNADLYQAPRDDQGNPVQLEREMQLAPGVVFDDLEEGEEVGTIQSNRPSGLLTDYVKHMMRGAAAGTGAGYSSVSKNYDGTYSAQRQELVEQWENYGLLSHQFIAQFVKPVWHRFVSMALFVIDLPDDVDPNRLFEADFLAPQMPWIDPDKESKGFERQLKLKIKSPQQIIRAAGHSPQNVLDQWEQWARELERRQLSDTTQDEAPTDPDNPDEDGDEDSDLDDFKTRSDAYGIAVRSGAITPQKNDEIYFRQLAGFPEPGDAVGKAWDAEATRRPITLAEPQTEPANTPEPDHSDPEE
nr:phage portal protein [Saccharospirillaceae bacterium]